MIELLTLTLYMSEYRFDFSLFHKKKKPAFASVLILRTPYHLSFEISCHNVLRKSMCQKICNVEKGLPTSKPLFIFYLFTYFVASSREKLNFSITFSIIASLEMPNSSSEDIKTYKCQLKNVQF